MNNDLINNNSESSESSETSEYNMKRPVGRPRKHKLESERSAKYKLRFNDSIYECNTIKEMTSITGKSKDCLFRLMKGHTTFRTKTSDELKNILIEIL